MGLALLWKPAGIGSQDFLGQFRRTLKDMPGRGREGIGHSGTLDPFAEGLLLVGTEEGTKLLTPLGGLPKTYVAEIILGATSATLDPESDIEASPHPVVVPSEARLREFLAAKIGSFQQVPPAYSAIMVNGQRSYDLARKGRAVELKARVAEVLEARHRTVSMCADWPHWQLSVTVSSGTYIRALARDWSSELVGYPGMLRTLVRTKIGPFEFGGPLKWLELSDLCPAFFDTLELGEDEARALRTNGLWKRAGGLPRDALALAPDGEIAAWINKDGKVGRVFRKNPLLPNS